MYITQSEESIVPLCLRTDRYLWLREATTSLFSMEFGFVSFLLGDPVRVSRTVTPVSIA